MKYFAYIFFILVLSSCAKRDIKENFLELEILNDTLVAYPFDKSRDTINVINYSITNNSNDIYYFMQGIGSTSLSGKIYKNGLFISIHEAISDKEVSYTYKFPFEHHNFSYCDSCFNYINSTRLNKNIERLNENIKGGYFNVKDIRHYFFIHPKEKLYFKEYVNLTDTLRYEDTRMFYANIYKNVKYYSKFYIPSDSTNFRQELPSNIIRTIEENNVKIFNGIVTAKNRVPVKVVE